MKHWILVIGLIAGMSVAEGVRAERKFDLRGSEATGAAFILSGESLQREYAKWAAQTASPDGSEQERAALARHIFSCLQAALPDLMMLPKSIVPADRLEPWSRLMYEGVWQFESKNEPERRSIRLSAESTGRDFKRALDQDRQDYLLALAERMAERMAGPGAGWWQIGMTSATISGCLRLIVTARSGREREAIGTILNRKLPDLGAECTGLSPKDVGDKPEPPK